MSFPQPPRDQQLTHAARIGGTDYPVDGMTIYGTAANKPTATDAHGKLPHAFFVETDTNERYQTDGSNWQHRRPVAAVTREIVNGDQIRDTNPHEYDCGPLQGFTAFSFMVGHDLGTDLRFTFYVGSSPLHLVSDAGLVRPYSAGTESRRHTVESGGASSRYAFLNAFPAPGRVISNPYLDYRGSSLRLRLTADAAPTDGSVNVFLIGLP